MRILALLLSASACFGQTIAKPGYSYFNQQHPLSQGLVSFIPLTEGIGAVVEPTNTMPVGFIRDVVQQGGGVTPAFFTQPPITTDLWVGSPYGWAINCKDASNTGSSSQRIDYNGSFNARGVTARSVPQLALGVMSVGIVMSPNAFTNAFGNIASRWIDDNADPFVTYGLTFDNTTKVRACVATGGAGTLTCGTGVSTTAGTWYRFMMTFDASNIRLYTDGLLSETTAKSGNASTAAGATFITCGVPESLGTQNGNLKIAGVWIWNRALSANEVSLWAADPWVMGRTPDEETLIAKFANANATKPKTRVSFQ